MNNNFLLDDKQHLELHFFTLKEPVWLYNHLIFLSIHGSQAYGLNKSDSDIDITGICIPPKQYFTGFLNKFDQYQSNRPDGTIFGIKKFMQLASEANPNVLEILWIDEKFWINANSSYIKLIQNRNLFLSTKVKHTYSGYAMSQLNRIKTHRKWLLNPPNHQPERKEFGLPEIKKISRDQQGALNQLIKNEVLSLNLNDNMMYYLDKENKYNRAKQEWEQYNIWKQTRNPYRANLESLYGYDTKHAMHLIRLMRQCREILTTEQLHVFRKDDREELLDVRNGTLSYDELIEWAEKEDKELDILAANSTLPHDSQRKNIDLLCQNLVEDFLGWNYK